MANSNPQTHAILEPQGASAHSYYALLKSKKGARIHKDKLFLVDGGRKPSFLHTLENSISITLNELRSRCFNGMEPIIISPTSEYLVREKNFEDYTRAGCFTTLSLGDAGVIHNKSSCYSMLHKDHFYDGDPDPYSPRYRLPKRYSDVITKPEESSGSKGVQKHAWAYECIDGVEYVVDVNTRSDMWLPRQTHQLKNGSDTYCTLIGRRHEDYHRLIDAAKDIVAGLKAEGILNLQVIATSSEIYFIEAALRLSGCAWMNLYVSDRNNLLLDGKKPYLDFHSLDVSSLCPLSVGKPLKKLYY